MFVVPREPWPRTFTALPDCLLGVQPVGTDGGGSSRGDVLDMRGLSSGPRAGEEQNGRPNGERTAKRVARFSGRRANVPCMDTYRSGVDGIWFCCGAIRIVP